MDDLKKAAETAMIIYGAVCAIILLFWILRLLVLAVVWVVMNLAWFAVNTLYPLAQRALGKVA